MYKASGESFYLSKAESMYNEFNIGSREAKEFSWDDKV
jgi:hypothetical protein